MTRRYLVAGAAALLVVVVFLLVFLNPKLGEIADVRDQIAGEQETRQSLQIKLEQLQNAERAAPATVARLAKFDRLLPPTPDLPALIRQLQGSATASGINLRSIAPSPPQPLANSTGISSISVTLQVQGGFFRLESFLARLEDLQRVAEVTSLAIAPVRAPETGIATLQSTITMRLYVVQPGGRVGPAPAASPSPTPTPRS